MLFAHRKTWKLFQNTKVRRSTFECTGNWPRSTLPGKKRLKPLGTRPDRESPDWDGTGARFEAFSLRDDRWSIAGRGTGCLPLGRGTCCNLVHGDDVELSVSPARRLQLAGSSFNSLAYERAIIGRKLLSACDQRRKLERFSAALRKRNVEGFWSGQRTSLEMVCGAVLWMRGK